MMLLVAWPIPLMVGLLLFRVGALLDRWVGFGLVGVWLSFGLLIQLAKPILGTGDPRMPRTPTPEEAAVLAPAWSDVVETLGIDESVYHLAVRDKQGSDGVADHRGGGFVMISAAAVHEFSPAELRALMSHEIGHLIGDGGTIVFGLSWELTDLARQPFTIVQRAVFRIGWPEWIGHIVTTLLWLGLYAAFGALLNHWFGPLATIGFAVGALVQGIGINGIRRRNQLNADRIAVDLGHGPSARAILDRRMRYDRLSPPMIWSQPPALRASAFLLRNLGPEPFQGVRLLAIDKRLHARTPRCLTRSGSREGGETGEIPPSGLPDLGGS
ncbi:hypothetical protein [Nocardia yunnanensis]|nr:hypothetical protein [Nocardia yunnanensis]